MTTPRALCLGEMLFDRLAEQSGPLETVTSWRNHAGGAPANVACGLAKLGTASAWLGCLGTDEAGGALSTVLESHGVSTQGLQHHAQAPTRIINVLRDDTGERHFAGFAQSPGSFADEHLQASQLPIPLFEAAEYLVLGSIPLAYEEASQAVNRALDLADQYYLKVFLDVNWRPSFWAEPEQAREKIRHQIKRADFLKLSLSEAEFLFETADPLDILRQQEQLEGVFLTAGQKGCAYACTQGLVGRLPAFVVPAIDTTGAGDSFVAALVHQLLQHGLRGLNSTAQIEEMLRYASAAGALTSMKPGAIAAQPTHAEIESFLVGRVD